MSDLGVWISSCFFSSDVSIFTFSLDAAGLDFGSLGILVLVDHDLVDALVHELVDLRIHPGRDKGGFRSMRYYSDQLTLPSEAYAMRLSVATKEIVVI
jgi:hypothetical protein